MLNFQNDNTIEFTSYKQEAYGPQIFVCGPKHFDRVIKAMLVNQCAQREETIYVF